MLLPRPSSFQHNSLCHIEDRSETVTKIGESLKTESTSTIHQVLHAGATVEVSRPILKPNRWCFYSSQEQVDQLLGALNSRGYRESALKETLLQEKSRICEQLNSFSVEKFHISGKFSRFFCVFQLSLMVTGFNFRIAFRLVSILWTLFSLI